MTEYTQPVSPHPETKPGLTRLERIDVYTEAVLNTIPEEERSNARSLLRQIINESYQLGFEQPTGDKPNEIEELGSIIPSLHQHPSSLRPDV